MKKVLFVTPVPQEKEKMFADIPGAEITFKDRKEVTADDVRDVNAILGNLSLSMLENCEKLEWLQLDSAGANTYSGLPEPVILTNASGAYGEAISEHMLGCTLMVMKNLARYLEIQKNHDFINLGGVNTLSISKVLCVGMGDIGTNYAQKMHALGATVYGVRRSLHDKPDFVDALYTMDTMDEILPECDIVALSLPETVETVHLFDEARLRKMKKGAMIINVGRGTAIVTDALLKVMEEEYLSAACLDVTDPEPLPRNHKLWNTKHVYITPHISGRFNAQVTFDKVLRIFHDNLVRYVNGEKLQNIVDRKIGY